MLLLPSAFKFNLRRYSTVHQFAPTYQEYVLHGTEGGAPRKFRMKTFVPMGQEMIAARSGGTPERGMPGAVVPGAAAAAGVAGAATGAAAGAGGGWRPGPGRAGRGGGAGGAAGGSGSVARAGAGAARAGAGAGRTQRKGLFGDLFGDIFGGSANPEAAGRSSGAGGRGGREAAGGGLPTTSAPPAADESDTAGMMQNVGFENSYGNRAQLVRAGTWLSPRHPARCRPWFLELLDSTYFDEMSIVYLALGPGGVGGDRG